MVQGAKKIPGGQLPLLPAPMFQGHCDVLIDSDQYILITHQTHFVSAQQLYPSQCDNLFVRTLKKWQFLWIQISWWCSFVL